MQALKALLPKTSPTSLAGPTGIVKHWKYERILSIATVPLCLYPIMTGPSRMCDFLLAFAIPAHMHMGMEQVVNDYLNVRKVGQTGNKAVKLGLAAMTGISIVGMTVFNVRQGGVTAFVRDLWHAKSSGAAHKSEAKKPEVHKHEAVKKEAHH